jgi:hypothetical protein
MPQSQQSLADGVVIDGVTQVIVGCGLCDVGFHLHADEEALRMGSFFVRNADMVGDLEVSKGNGVHRKKWVFSG